MKAALCLMMLALGVISCRPPGQLKAEYDPVVTELFGPGPRLVCQVTLNHRSLGVLSGCAGTRADTLVYLWSNTAGAVVSFGRHWTVDMGQHRQAYDSLAEALTASEKTQPVTCSNANPSWEIVDRRWESGTGLHHALILSFIPGSRLTPARLQRVTQLGAPRCDERYSIPLIR